MFMRLFRRNNRLHRAILKEVYKEYSSMVKTLEKNQDVICTLDDRNQKMFKNLSDEWTDTASYIKAVLNGTETRYPSEIDTNSRYIPPS